MYVYIYTCSYVYYSIEQTIFSYVNMSYAAAAYGVTCSYVVQLSYNCPFLLWSELALVVTFKSDVM